MSAAPQSTDLRNRVIFTIFILSVYRLGTFVPIPGIDPDQLQILMESNQKGLLGMFNVFAGGAVSRMAIFALGIMPYISSSIIVQLLTGVSDYFKNLKNQGEIGRKKISQITRYGTVLLATIQGYGLSVGLESSANLVINPGFYFKISTVTTIVAGTIFLMWLGEQITQRGIGNGISLIIFSGIVAEIPRALATTFELGRTGALSTIVIISIFSISLLSFSCSSGCMDSCSSSCSNTYDKNIKMCENCKNMSSECKEACVDVAKTLYILCKDECESNIHSVSDKLSKIVT